MGESGSGKSHTLAGEGTSKAGIVPMIFDALFTRLQAGNINYIINCFGMFFISQTSCHKIIAHF